MSSPSSMLERSRLQTTNLPPDKFMHMLTPEQTGSISAPVLYKKRSGNAGFLGGGSFGSVHLEYSDSECEFAPPVRAVKIISKITAEESKVHWEQEIENLITLSKFPDLFVKILGWWEDDKSIYLPMEYFEASDLSRCKTSIEDESEIRAISQQIVLGLEKMHGLGIIHRDLKPQNVFVASQRPAWKVKIGDFGFSKRVSESVSAPYSIRGTIKYMAPEYRDLWNNREKSDFTTAVDMWSFGCLIYELFAQKCPFEEEDSKSLKKYTKDKVFPRQPLEKIGASSDSMWLITKLLDPDPDLRLSAEDALSCAWFSDTNTTCAQQMHEIDLSAENLTVRDRLHHQPSVETLEDTGSVSPTFQTLRTDSAPPEFVISEFEGDNKSQDDSPPPLPPHRPDLPDRAVTVDSTPILHDDITLHPEGIYTPRLPPRLPPRPKSCSSLRAAPSNNYEGPRSNPLPRKSSVASLVEPEIIKPDSVEVPGSPSIRPAMPRRYSTTAPSLRSAKSDGVNIEMDFKDLPFAVKPKPMCDICESRLIFNPVIKPAILYFCKGCSHRPLCQRCIVELIRNPGDPHEADHYLQAWVHAHYFPLREFFRQYSFMPTTELGLEKDYGRSWLHSNHAFLPPTGGRLTTRFAMHAPPGIYTVSIDFRTLKCGEKISSSVLGSTKSLLVKKAKQVPLGSMVFAAQALDAKHATAAPGRYLPDGMLEYEVALTEEQHSQRITLGHAIHIGQNHLLEVHILGSYDTVFFKAGCPFRWWLDQITIEQLGTPTQVASMGDLQTRSNVLAQQARQHHDRKVQKNMSLLGQSVKIAGAVVPMIPGTRTITKAATNALSGVVALGATAMKHDDNGIQMGSSGHHGAPAPIVYNQYLMVGSEDGVQYQQHQQHQQYQQLESEFEYKELEYEVAMQGEYYEYQATQQPLTEGEPVEQWGYQYQEESQHQMR